MLKKYNFIRSGIFISAYLLGSATSANAQHTRSSGAVFQMEDVLPWILFITTLAFFFIAISIKQKLTGAKEDYKKNGAMDKNKN